jgi:hypothetical protein
MNARAVLARLLRAALIDRPKKMLGISVPGYDGEIGATRELMTGLRSLGSESTHALRRKGGSSASTLAGAHPLVSE